MERNTNVQIQKVKDKNVATAKRKVSNAITQALDEDDMPT